jgi:hypothetical protein
MFIVPPNIGIVLSVPCTPSADAICRTFYIISTHSFSFYNTFYLFEASSVCAFFFSPLSCVTLCFVVVNYCKTATFLTPQAITAAPNWLA